MTELELLQTYEPVLRFARSERFFPMAVDAYLEQSVLHSTSARGFLRLMEYAREGRALPLGELGSQRGADSYLRFINDHFDIFSFWRWMLALFLLSLAVGAFFWGWTGVEADLLFSFVVALFLFMLVSPVRLRVIPALLGALFLCGVSVFPIWLFLHSTFEPAPLYLIGLPIYITLFVGILYFILRVMVEVIVPEGPGMVMDMFSRATEKVAEKAYQQYARILQKDNQSVYYGRVLHEADPAGNVWTVLQYHLFYAFNDWRLAANGFNHHEGDWELIAVYLKNDAPYGAGVSQHGAGGFLPWDEILRARGENGGLTTHPIFYVALGSHANYFRPDIIRTASLYTGKLRRFLFWLDGVIHYLFLFFNPDQQVRAAVMENLMRDPGYLLNQESLASAEIPTASRDDFDRYVLRLPLEIASGEGFRAAPHPDKKNAEERVDSDKILKDRNILRATTRPAISTWRAILLNSDWDWVQYRGLWGVKSWLDEESGAPGPRWERPSRKNKETQERIRWNSPLVWLKQLEKNYASQ